MLMLYTTSRETTVWKLQNLSVIQILREIKIGESRVGLPFFGWNIPNQQNS